MNLFALSLALMLALVLGELLILSVVRRASVPWREIVFNLNSGHILMWVLRGVEVFAFGLLLTHANLHWVDQWPSLFQWVFAFVAWDFCFYWMHRLHHKLPIFWSVHVVHHQGEHFNLSLGIRNSWYSSLTSFPFVAILAILGVPLATFVVVSSIHYFVQFYNHNGLVKKSGILEKFLVTPSHHRVHHATDPIYLNLNFGGTLLIWDQLFGTFQPELDSVAMRYGVPGSTPTYNPFWANNLPFFAILNRAYSNIRSAHGQLVSDRYIVTGGIILFGLVVHYVNFEELLSGIQQLNLFALIFCGTIALGGLADNQHWGRVSWVLLALLAPSLFFGFYGSQDGWGTLFLSLMLLHGMDGLRRILFSSIVID